MLAQYVNVVNTPNVVRRRASRPVSPSRAPPAGAQQPKNKPPRSAPPKSTYPIPAPESKKYLDDKILTAIDAKVIEGRVDDGIIRIDGVAAYNDEKLKKGLVRVEKINGHLCVNGNVVMKKFPGNPATQPMIDTDQVEWFTIKIGKPGESFNGNSDGVSFGNWWYNLHYQDNINKNRTTLM